MHLETQERRDRAIKLAAPIGVAAVAARRSAGSGLEQALDASHDLQRQLKRLVDRAEPPTRKAAAAALQTAGAGLSQLMDRRHELEDRLRRLTGRSKRPSREMVIAAGAVLVLAGIGAALLASGPVNRAVRGQVDRLRARWRGGKAMIAAAGPTDHEEDLLDDRLDASFPASDPVGAHHVT